MRSLRLSCALLVVAAAAVSFAPRLAAAQVIIKPYFLLMVDSSGSMSGATTCAVGTTNSCGQPCTRINDAKCAIQRVVAGTGDAAFGLGQFSQECKLGCGDVSSSAGQLVCNATAASGVIRVGLGEENQAAITSWVDYTCLAPPGACATTAAVTHNEIYSGGNTPLGGVLERARCYYRGTCGDTTPASPLIGDTAFACRPVAVILLTDGAETCGGNAVAAATALRSAAIGGGMGTKDIRTYVIGFGVAPPPAAASAPIEAIAVAGGTTRGYYATNETSLSLALSQIIAGSALVETCNGNDDNCNVIRDDGLPKFCNTPRGVAPPDCSNTAVDRPLCMLCAPPAETFCDGVDNNCNGAIDEGLLNACGLCGAAPTEVCDGVDNDCDGAIDEPPACIMGCTPSAEICDNLDNDCDGMIDEMVSRGCGLAVGNCTVGTQVCTAGVWGACSGRGPAAEMCNNIDDDCDGVVDGQTRACGTDVGECIAGFQLCTAGVFGATCLGSVAPTTEVCDTLDNDCDGMTDESDPGLGVACGESTPPCMAGTMACVAGSLVCEGAIGPTTEICNNIDDDCDGVIDDGLAVGSSCGTDTGECSPGINVCSAGVLTCTGEIAPLPETCNGLDDDCNGIIDDVPGVGAACGVDLGICMAGVLQCIMGREACVGGTSPGTEVCDCEDNDCDGTVDEEPSTGTLCPAGSSCVECSCARPCITTEFGFSCPTGRVPFEHDGMCDCVPPRCEAATCAAQTVDQAGTVVCAPASDGVPVCVCKSNACTFPCEGVTCMGGTVCDPDTGRCADPSCRTIPCGTGDYCDGITGACVPSPCATTMCASSEACRDGVCVPSCAGVTCAPDETCSAGVCNPALCATVTCPVPGEVCNPDTGACVEDTCATLTCPRGTVCDLTTRACIVNPCLLVRCPAAQACVDGECVVDVGPPDMGPPDGGPDGGHPPVDAGKPPLRVLASGGGGCVCEVGAGAATGNRAGGLAALGLALVAFVGRRRRAASARINKVVAK